MDIQQQIEELEKRKRALEAEKATLDTYQYTVKILMNRIK